MTKARTLADFVSSGSPLADGTISVSEVVGAAPLANPTFTGDLTAPEIDLAAIAKSITDTAVDVFVYRTADDSDGGKWRKRTQHTSWYNEAASATRGSRKEFPSVAVIVAESNQVTIYDGDDPDMPMWIVICNNSNFAGVINSVAALNGIVTIGRSDYVGCLTTNFLSEVIIGYHDNNSYYGKWGGSFRGYISVGGDIASGWSGSSDYSIVSRNVNDVAMTVLPNAPIDAATGLPVPTIAVATDSNVSIIRDNGNVVDITYANYNVAKNIYFNSKHHLIYSQNNTGTQRMVKVYYDIPSSDLNNPQGGYQRGAETVAYADNGVGFDVSLHPSTVGIQALSENSIGTSVKLILTDETTPPTSTMLNFITSDHQTGWMNGAIKLATLSDTDTANVTGAELVTNGTFASNTTGWTAASGTTLSVDTNRLKVTVSTGGGNAGYQVITTVSGYTYTLSATLQKGSASGNAYIRAGTGISSSAYGSSVAVTSTSATEVSFTFTATGTSTYITAICSNAGNHAFFDNVSVRLAEEDRSVNGNGLQVFGSITKTAVATGADLVGYSGFSGSNYLQQPYNADLDFGTGDFCYMGWVKTSTSAGKDVWIQRTDGGTAWGTNATVIMQHTSGEFLVQAGGQWAVTSGASINDGQWHFVTVVRSNGVVNAYWDTQSKLTFTGAAAQANGDDTVVLGVGKYGGGLADAHGGSLALFRISATAPSPEQIAKIYNDEKHLFQAGAQATLYGTSDAVTALAHDDTTDLLHVGTSAGRSVFQGLRRVDNTTDAITAAISASNGLVAEE